MKMGQMWDLDICKKVEKDLFLLILQDHICLLIKFVSVNLTDLI